MAAEEFSPPRAPFFIEGSNDRAEGTSTPSSGHSRKSSGDTLSAAVNPFSPPQSVVSFSMPGSTPGTPRALSSPMSGYFPEPSSRNGSVISAGDVPSRMSSYSGPRPQNIIESNPFASGPPTRNNSGIRLREALSPPSARPFTIYGAASTAIPAKHTRARSTMLREDQPLEKPWLDKSNVDNKATKKGSRLAYAMTWFIIFLGVVGSAVRCYFGWQSVKMFDEKDLCLIMDEDFSGSEESLFGPSGKWQREVEVGGFGNGEFSMTTASSKNSYVRDGKLHIVPTLTKEEIGALDAGMYNATGCTWDQTAPLFKDDPNNEKRMAAQYQNCGVVANSSTGIIIPPIQTARLTTRLSASIRYGRVEVKAKIPTGDWIWPAIWMMPTRSEYGAWPASGEIDIMEARGNGPEYAAQGNHHVRGSLNWGPYSFLNGVAKTYGAWTKRRQGFNQDFHTYSLEWTEDWLRIFVDSRLQYMLEVNFDEDFFTRGQYPPVVKVPSGETIILQNPWEKGTKAAPFDKEFYLILNVAVGSRNGWFPDNLGDKPWADASTTAMREFAAAESKWLPTWPTAPEDRGMVVDSVKMWQKCNI